MSIEFALFRKIFIIYRKRVDEAENNIAATCKKRGGAAVKALRRFQMLKISARRSAKNLPDTPFG